MSPGFEEIDRRMIEGMMYWVGEWAAQNGSFEKGPDWRDHSIPMFMYHTVHCLDFLVGYDYDYTDFPL